jgi:acyl-coenzyme A synthetase/AMP-(fatty) acid ligase
MPSGDIRYLSRRDRQIKIRGQRSEPGEIERLILGSYLATQAWSLSSPLRGEAKNCGLTWPQKTPPLRK